MAQTYKRVNPLFGLSGEHALSVGAQGILLRSVNVIAYLVPSYCMQVVTYQSIAIFCIIFRISEPRAWQDLYGRWTDAYTVRRYWR